MYELLSEDPRGAVPESSYSLTTASDLLKRSFPPETFLIPFLIPANGTTVLYGQGGIGKTAVGLEMCIALNLGEPFANHQTFAGDFSGRPVATAWLSLEAGWDDEMYRRLMAHPQGRNGPLLVEPGTARLRDLVANGIGNGNEHMWLGAKAHAAWKQLFFDLKRSGIGVLFVDSIQHLAGPVGVNNASLPGEFYSLFDEAQSEHGITTVLIGHTSQHVDARGKTKTELMGASAWVDQARHSVLVAGNSTKTWLRTKKSNRGETGVNVTLDKVRLGPIVVRDVTVPGASATVDSGPSTQKRDWETSRGYARRVRDLGEAQPDAGHWLTQKSLGEAVGMSRKIGANLVNGKFFIRLPDGTYMPNDELIDSDWEALQS